MRVRGRSTRQGGYSPRSLGSSYWSARHLTECLLGVVTFVARFKLDAKTINLIYAYLRSVQSEPE